MSTSSPVPRFGSPGGTSSSALLLGRQYKQMQNDKDLPGISCGLIDNNVFSWEVMLMLPDESGGLYGGGCFRSRLDFPPEYPHMPPKMKFVTPIWHPNSEFSFLRIVALSASVLQLLTMHPTVYESGEVCISILHPPEEDKYGYESAAERWSPVQTPETILLSVISMLSSPNDESPANIEAGKQWREDPASFKKKVRRCVRDSQESAWD
ncbi:ubiquitin-conjugating enzyme [Aureobasidium pullulans]|nr:ubiquitin-conjugating enzyme [Aureobasidium pullulans]